MEPPFDAVQPHRSRERVGFIRTLKRDEAVSMYWPTRWRGPRKDLARVKKGPDAVAQGPKDIVARTARGAHEAETAAGGGSSTSRA